MKGGSFLKIVLIVMSVVAVKSSYSQSVKELEEDLIYKPEKAYGNKKDIARQLLTIEPLNEVAINYLVEVYHRNNQRDSIKILFDSLIKNNPNTIAPYLLAVRERNARYINLTYNQRIHYLKKAYLIDRTDEEVLYMLGKLYYELFIKEYNRNRKKVNLLHYARNAIKYFDTLFEQNDSYKEILKFPLLQLSNYLGIANIKKYEDCNIGLFYFPIDAFMSLPSDWKTNFSVNVLDFASGVEGAVFTINWYSGHLKALEEPVLIDSSDTKVFRFIWLRTFNHPVVVRVENSNDSITLYWKESDGAGGYEPGKIIVNESKKLTLKEWEEIVNKLDSIDFWGLPSIEKEILGTDGAQWILEGKENGKYHVVDRWSGGEIAKVCLYLLGLTDLEVKEEDIY